MRTYSLAGAAFFGALVLALGCSRNPEPEETQPQPTPSVSQDTLRPDTTGVGQQNPPGYRGMERDTTLFPPKDTTGQQKIDSLGVPQVPQADTTGYQRSGDTTGYQPSVTPDTTDLKPDTSSLRRD